MAGQGLELSQRAEHTWNADCLHVWLLVLIGSDYGNG